MRAEIAAAAPRLAQFARFCVVGAVGFVVDAGVLQVVLHVFAVGPIWGRLLSFAIAVLTTFELNRRWAFRRRGERPYLSALASYLSVQGLGFACNFSIYTLLYLGLPADYDDPLLCLAVASAVALVVNYVGASVVVFRARVPQGGGPLPP